MIRYVRAWAAACLAWLAVACAGPKPETPAQAYFVAKSAYVAVQEEAARYVELPTAAPKVVAVIKRVDREAVEAMRLADAAIAAERLLDPAIYSNRLRAGEAVLNTARKALVAELAKASAR